MTNARLGLALCGRQADPRPVAGARCHPEERPGGQAIWRPLLVWGASLTTMNAWSGRRLSTGAGALVLTAFGGGWGALGRSAA